jgi:hypothetical protein
MTTEAEIREMIAKLEVALLMVNNPSSEHTELFSARRALLWVLSPECAVSPTL